MTTRDALIFAAIALALYLLTRRPGTVTARIYGADVAPDVDVAPAGPRMGLFGGDDDEGWEE